ncbi:MAG: polysaccharide deacetylase family protein [Pseudomonadota bacterium]
MTDRRVARHTAFRNAGYRLTLALALVLPLHAAGARFLAVFALLAGVLLFFSALRRPRGVPVLVYHSVSPDAGWLPWSQNTSVRPETLRCHLQTLRDLGWTVIPTMDLIRARLNGSRLPSRCVVLHFDDGYLDNFLFAAPILRAFNAPATFFASTDFIASGDTPRDGAENAEAEAWAGYMNRAELRALDSDPLFDVEAHGTNHARIPVSDRVVTRAGSDWKKHAPLYWAIQDGDKSGWYVNETPPPSLEPGTAIPENDSALAGRWWKDGRAETDDAFLTRVAHMVQDAHEELTAVLGRAPEILAWPFDRCCPLSIHAARKAGFIAVTGGRGDNLITEDPTILSRIHLNDHAFGQGPIWLESLSLRAKLNTAGGHVIWHVLTAFANLCRHRRFTQSRYEIFR